MAYLLVPDKKQTRKVPLKKNIFFIGRARENDLIIPSDSLSRFHAQITRKENTYFISDRGSLNGVYLNGTRIHKETQLHDGDVIGFGTIHVRFFLEKEKLLVEKSGDPEKYQRFSVSQIMDSRQFAPERRERYLELLYQFSARLLQQVPASDIGEVALEMTQDVWNPDRTCLMIREATGEWQIANQRYGKNPYITGENLEISRSLIKELEANEEALLISRLGEDERFVASESMQRQNVNSVMCAPLWNNKKIHGFLYADLIMSTRRFVYEDLEMFVILANLIAMKLENDSLWHQTLIQQQLEQEMNLAAEIQRKFFPVVPLKLQDYDFGATNIPTRKVGGDAYFWHLRSDGNVVLMIADVMGKGLPAALLMSQLQAIMAIFSEQYATPDEMVTEVNRFIYQNSTQEKFITMVVVMLSPESGKIRYCNSGHNPPFLLKPAGAREFLEEGGMPVGIFEDQVFIQGQTSMDGGDVLVLYTDGLVEARNEKDEEFDISRLIETTRSHTDLPADKLASQLVHAIKDQWLATDQEDDWTLLIIKRL